MKVPRAALTRDETSMLHFNVTGEPIPPWAVGVDPVPEECGPPADHDVVDPPTPDEYAAPRADRSALRDLGRGRAEVRPHIPSEAGSDRNMGASRVPCVGAQEGFAMWMRLRGLATPPTFEAEPIRNARPAKSDPATYAIRRPESERAHNQRLLRDHRPNVLRRASPSHFHVCCGSHDAVVRIDTLEIVDGALPRRARALVLEWATEHRAELNQNWVLAEQHQPLQAIEPLD